MDGEDPEARIRELEVGSYTESPGASRSAPALPPPTPYPPAPPPPVWTPYPPQSQQYPPQYGPASFSGGSSPRRPLLGLNRIPRRIGSLIFGLIIVYSLWNALGPMLKTNVPHLGTGSSTSAPITVTRGGELTVGGNDETHVIACNDGKLTASGNANTFTVTGHCLSLDVTGNDTHVTIDSADTIDAGGINTVTVYHSGNPKITKSGINVEIHQG